ncbi:Anaerobic C4-dicarboxylate transporter DcuA [Serratia marcescens]|uniref:anaerobic C4-dicarboxylate transporter family protein n=1 Tax=Serratia marcescens TaxID=615 RepID=UPI00217B58BA|nr:anaerobic C4-dicarboxylate transporter family protein [Serratia marcescens]CAI1985896.1 Anaerobic C4-dicarboxylate transporter DcuA [Serratia marcescens]
MLAVELVIVLLAIFLGARLGGIGIGFAGGLGVLVLALIGVKPGSIPFDVISIIMAVIAAISAMQVAGGMDYLVQQTEKLLRKNPKHITILAPIVTYFLTIFAGTGNISLSALPVIAEVAKEQGIKPCRPLSTAVVSAQIAITASPISAAVVYMSSVMEGHGVSYLHLLMVVIPSTFCAVLVMSLLVTWLFDSKLSNDPVYLKRLEEGLITLRGNNALAIKPRAKASVLLFLLGVLCVVAYAIINSPGLGLVAKPLMPMALALNVSPLTAVASFAAVSGLFILPTYPTLVAAVQMDDTGTTRIGRFVFNHPFFIPGTMGVIFAVVFGFLLGSVML